MKYNQDGEIKFVRFNKLFQPSLENGEKVMTYSKVSINGKNSP